MQEEPIDSEHQKPSKPKELWTVKLLLLSVASTVLTILIVTLDGELSIPHRSVMTTTPILIGTTFLSSLAGFIVGFYERKKNKRQALFGIIANLLVLIFYVLAAMAIISVIQSFGPN